MALLVALEYPDLVDRLILVSSSPGLRDEADRKARRGSDEDLARRIETIGLDAFLTEWLEGPVTGTSHLDDDVRRTDRTVRNENTAAGLASALRVLGQGAQPFVGDRLNELSVPVLTISGERDEKYQRLAARDRVVGTRRSACVDPRRRTQRGSRRPKRARGTGRELLRDRQPVAGRWQLAAGSSATPLLRYPIPTGILRSPRHTPRASTGSTRGRHLRSQRCARHRRALRDHAEFVRGPPDPRSG